MSDSEEEQARDYARRLVEFYGREPRVVYTHTPPRVDDDATVKADPFSITAFNDGPHTITSGRLWDGDLLATYRRARAQVVDAIATGLRDAGLTDEATIERLTAAIVKRLGEG